MYKEILLINRHFKDLNPLLLGTEDCKSGHCAGFTVRDYYLVHFVKSGKGVIKSPYGTFPVKKNQIFVIRPNEINVYRADKDEPWDYIWFGCDGETAKRFSNGDKVVYDYNGNIFYELLNTSKLNNMREEFVTSKILELMCELFDKKDNSVNYTQICADYIDAHFMENISVDSISKIIGLNRRYLSRIFKKTYNKTIQEYIIDKRINQAKKLLTDKYMVYEVARLCGYEDVFNFSRMFKKHVGVSPNFYKNNGA